MPTENQAVQGTAENVPVLEQAYVIADAECATTGSIALAAARRVRESTKSPTTGELTSSDLRWFGRKATLTPTLAPAVAG